MRSRAVGSLPASPSPVSSLVTRSFYRPCPEMMDDPDNGSPKAKGFGPNPPLCRWWNQRLRLALSDTQVYAFIHSFFQQLLRGSGNHDRYWGTEVIRTDIALVASW